jgi:N-acylglucosamine-6-phosphate 2-epimerase
MLLRVLRFSCAGRSASDTLQNWLPRGRAISTIEKLARALIVSCQASEGEPLCAPEHIKALALSAINGGAGALRLEGHENVKALRPATELPIIALAKSKTVPDSERLTSVFITSTFKEAEELACTGPEIIAIDATARKRPDGLSLRELIAKIHKELRKLVLADIATLDEARAAEDCGADLVSTTLFGYTAETALPSDAPPSMDLLTAVVKHLRVPVILEGRIWHPHEVKQAFELGAYAVVVGSAITRPQLITERFVRAVPRKISSQQASVG